MQHVADALKRVNKWPGELNFDASRVFKDLAATVNRAITFRHDGAEIGSIVAIVNQDWALTVRGLESLGKSFLITRELIKAGDAIEKPEWVGVLATPERTQWYSDAVELAGRFFRSL
jgi:hypothetical protein